MKIEYQDHIDDYLLDRMSEEERKIFEEQIRENEELREQLEYSKSVQAALKSRGEKLAKMKIWDKETSRTNSRSLTRKLIYGISGMAAIFVVGVFVGRLYFVSLSENVTESESEACYIGQNDSYSYGMPDETIDIETQIANGDYAEALAQLEKDEEDVRTELVLLERDMYARGSDQEDAKKKQEEYENRLIHILFLKAKALLGLNRKNEAFEVLSKIRQKNCKDGVRADSLYRQLKNSKY